MGEGDKRSRRVVPRDGSEAVSSELDAETVPRIARTTTLDDPLTTSLLAEVARRSRTIEVTPEQIAEATDLEPAPAAAAGSSAAGALADSVDPV